MKRHLRKTENIVAEQGVQRSFRRGRKSERGAIALEYILIAALVALAIVGGFMYLGRQAREATQDVGGEFRGAVNMAIEEGRAKALNNNSTNDNSTNDNSTTP